MPASKAPSAMQLRDILDNWNYQIAFVAPPISDVTKIYRCIADSEEGALQKLTDYLGHPPEDYRVQPRGLE